MRVVIHTPFWLNDIGQTWTQDAYSYWVRAEIQRLGHAVEQNNAQLGSDSAPAVRSSHTESVSFSNASSVYADLRSTNVSEGREVSASGVRHGDVGI